MAFPLVLLFLFLSFLFLFHPDLQPCLSRFMRRRKLLSEIKFLSEFQALGHEDNYLGKAPIWRSTNPILGHQLGSQLHCHKLSRIDYAGQSTMAA
jgi:hypothetical protein